MSIQSVDTKTKIPEQLYVTLKYDQAAPDEPLGFMSPYEPGNAGFIKRRQTQLEWAYTKAYNHTKYRNVDWYCSKIYTWDNDPNACKLLFQQNDESNDITFWHWVEDPSLPRLTPEPHWGSHTSVQTEDGLIPNCSLQPAPTTSKYLPKILDNVPQSGFQFTKEVRRTYWGGGNVVWRVLDPRGFQLEISSANLARIIDCSVIKEGTILDECVWGRSGAANVLLPISSDIYQNAKQNTIRKATDKKISLKDVQLGDIVKLSNSDVDVNGEYKYYGKFNVITTNTYYSVASYRSNRHENEGIMVGYENTNIYEPQAPIFERYVFERVDNLSSNKERIAFISQPKIHSIVKRMDVPADKNVILNSLNSFVKAGYFEQEKYNNRTLGYNHVAGFSISKVNDIKYDYSKPIDFDIVDYHYGNKTKTFQSHIVRKDGILYISVMTDGIIAVIPCTINNNKIEFETKVTRTSYRGNMKEFIFYKLDDSFYSGNSEWFYLDIIINNQFSITQNLIHLNQF